MNWTAWLRKQPPFADVPGAVEFTRHGAVLRFTFEGQGFALRPCSGSRRLVHNSRLASEHGWGPQWMVGDEDGFVVRWWEQGASPRHPSEKRAVEGLLERIHRSGVRFVDTARATDALVAGRARWEKRGRSLPESVEEKWVAWIETAAELEASGPSAPLHGDPHPENILVLGDKAMLLDWEYSGIGDPDWDLGYWSALSGSPPLNRRAEKYSTLAHAAWRLWFADEDKVSLMNKPLF